MTTLAGRGARPPLDITALRQAAASLDWDQHKADTQYLTHAVHRYSGKFIPQIARQALELITYPGETILDPYCGSGTTLLEASLAGRHAIGSDLNPLAVLIAKVKTQHVPRAAIESVQSCMAVALADQDSSDGQLTLLGTGETPSQDARFKDPWFRKWFRDKRLSELIAIKRRIDALDGPVRDLSLLAFSDILRRVSNAHSGYPNVMFDKSKSSDRSAIRAFLKRLSEVAEAVDSLTTVAQQKHWHTFVMVAEAQQLPIASDSIHGIVTHPPYIGSIPYAEYGMLSLRWLGYDHRILDEKLTGGKRQTRDVVDRFRAGFRGMFGEAYRVLVPGRCMFMLVGSPTVRGRVIDLDVIAREIAEDVGFVLACTVTRRGTNRRANKMKDETGLFFQKPVAFG